MSLKKTLIAAFLNGYREVGAISGHYLDINGEMQPELLGDPKTFFQSPAAHLQIVIDIR